MDTSFSYVMDESGERLDKWLAQKFTGKSRDYIHHLIQNGEVTVDGEKVKPSFRPAALSCISGVMPPSEVIAIEAEDIPLDIVYEDEWLAVINKPQGMVVHPAVGHYSGTLVNALMYHFKDKLSDINGVLRPGIVHRIDKDTSGLILIVKSNQIHEKISEMIQNHDIARSYKTIVYGMIKDKEIKIVAPIGRDPNERQKMKVVEQGKAAITHAQVIKNYSKLTYLDVQLETGRTHQIRVHLKYIGHPVVGDPLYAGGLKDYGLKGQALHAYQLVFQHPMTHQEIEVQAPLPAWFKNFLETAT